EDGRPDDSVLVVALLDRGGHHAAGADPVAPHYERLLRPVLVEERRVERHGVLRPELKDVADLDRGAERQRAAADDAAVALDRHADVREAHLVVAAGLDAAKVPPGAVRAGDELSLAQRLVRDHLSLESHRAQRAGVRAERLPD